MWKEKGGNHSQNVSPEWIPKREEGDFESVH
jgi:hypothetical protein